MIVPRPIPLTRRPTAAMPWVARCPAKETPAVVVVDLVDDTEDIAGALRQARPWRRRARAGLYEPHFVQDDSRSDNRSSF
jgi:hypothetical protein